MAGTRIKTHFARINNQFKRQERDMVSLNLKYDTEANPWWILKYMINYRGINEVEVRLRNAVQRGRLIIENVVRRGRKGFHVRDVCYFWCPDKKFALRLTRYVNSSPHYLELTGNIRAARQALFNMGI